MMRILHVLPGRLRLGFDAVKGRPDLASKMHRHLEAVSGIRRVTVDTRTGSVLMLFDPGALKSAEFLNELSTVLGSMFPAHIAPGRVRFTSKRLKGHPELAKRIRQQLAAVRGIEHIEIDPATGGCLLIYDPKIVTSPGFRDALPRPLALLVPELDVPKLLSRLGLRR